VQIRDNPANRVITDRVLRSGETIEIPNRPGIVLTTGKAENLDLLLDGQEVEAFGGPGVRRNIALEPDRLRAPSAQAAPPAPAPRPTPTPPTPPRP
jgi:cytoskeleton protein RodZ